MVDKYAHPLVIIHTYNEKVKTKPTFSAFFFRPKCHTMYTPPPAPSLTMSNRVKPDEFTARREFMCYLVHKVPGGNSGPEIYESWPVSRFIAGLRNVRLVRSALTLIKITQKRSCSSNLMLNYRQNLYVKEIK